MIACVYACMHASVTYVFIGSGNDLLLDGTKPLMASTLSYTISYILNMSEWNLDVYWRSLVMNFECMVN